MPNGLAQQDLLWAVHDAAGLDPSDTPVVEVRAFDTFLLTCVHASCIYAKSIPFLHRAMVLALELETRLKLAHSLQSWLETAQPPTLCIWARSNPTLGKWTIEDVQTCLWVFSSLTGNF